MSEQAQMDAIAYSSRMLDWSPLGKLFFVLCMLIVGLLTDSILVTLITFTIGIILMGYSTRFRVPLILSLAIGEAILIMILGSGMISIMGDTNQPALWDGKFQGEDEGSCHGTSIGFHGRHGSVVSEAALGRVEHYKEAFQEQERISVDQDDELADLGRAFDRPEGMGEMGDGCGTCER